MEVSMKGIVWMLDLEMDPTRIAEKRCHLR